MKMKIAIYSGVIPSTTFIENLIETLASGNNTIFLYGRVSKKFNYKNKNILVFSFPEFVVVKYFYVGLYFLKLFFQSRSKFNLLNNHIKSSGQSYRKRINLWAKYLPVVLNLPDVFHIQWVSSVGEWVFLKKVFGIRIAVSLRGVQININPVTNIKTADIYRSVFPLVDGFHAVSKSVSIEGFKYGANTGKIKVIYSGVDSEIISPFEKINCTASTPFRILSIGRFHWTKGFGYALDAISLLENSDIKFEYTIVTNRIPEEIIYQIEDLNLSSKINIIKILPQNKVFQLMQESDLLLLPSVEEGVANVVLESMAIGLPVLSSDCGGMPEVIQHGVNGYLYKNRDVSDLAAKLEFIFSESFQNKSGIIQNAKKYVRTNHNLNLLGTRMTEFYRDLMLDNKSL